MGLGTMILMHCFLNVYIQHCLQRRSTVKNGCNPEVLHNTFRKVHCSTTGYTAAEKLTSFHHTGLLEIFHFLLLKHRPKQLEATLYDLKYESTYYTITNQHLPVPVNQWKPQRITIGCLQCSVQDRLL